VAARDCRGCRDRQGCVVGGLDILSLTGTYVARVLSQMCIFGDIIPPPGGCVRRIVIACLELHSHAIMSQDAPVASRGGTTGSHEHVSLGCVRTPNGSSDLRSRLCGLVEVIKKPSRKRLSFREAPTARFRSHGAARRGFVSMPGSALGVARSAAPCWIICIVYNRCRKSMRQIQEISRGVSRCGAGRSRLDGVANLARRLGVAVCR